MTAKPVAEFWYGIQPQPDDMIWLREVFVDNYAVGDSWIIRGEKLDLVVDTCSGIVPLAPVVAALTTRPVLAIALNDSYDHAGSWWGFDNRACHPLDAPVLRDPSLLDYRISDYLEDDRLFALPAPGYTTADYRMVGAEPTRTLDEGDVIDLGNRSIEVLHTPGRGKGGLSLWEDATGTLFTSDMLYDGDHGLAWPPEHPDLYISSLKRYLDLPVRKVHPGHYGSFGRQRMETIIGEQIADLHRLSCDT